MRDTLKLVRILATTLIASGSLAGGANAAVTSLYQVGTDTSSFFMGVGESRETHFQALNNVTLTALGARINPNTSSTQLRWRIFNSDEIGSFGAVMLDQLTSFTDLGLGVYDLPVTINLSAGTHYILSLQSVSGSDIMSKPNELDQGLPFVTSGGDFQIFDGGANMDFSNVVLPSFSVTSTAVPEPSAVALFGLAGLGLMLRRRRR